MLVVPDCVRVHSMNCLGWRDESKRDSSTAQADCFARAKRKKRRRPASVGMTGLGVLAKKFATTRGRRINCDGSTLKQKQASEEETRHIFRF